MESAQDIASVPLGTGVTFDGGAGVGRGIADSSGSLLGNIASFANSLGQTALGIYRGVNAPEATLPPTPTQAGGAQPGGGVPSRGFFSGETGTLVLVGGLALLLLYAFRK